MKPEFIEFIGLARKRRSDKFRNQLYIFIVCLVISCFIWALVRLSREYYYTFDYHLTYTHIPANYQLVSASDSILTIKIKLQGFDFFSGQFIFPAIRSYGVSLQNIKVKTHDTRIVGMMLTHPIGKEIAAETNFQSEVFSLNPDTLFFEFERRHPRNSLFN